MRTGHDGLGSGCWTAALLVLLGSLTSDALQRGQKAPKILKPLSNLTASVGQSKVISCVANPGLSPDETVIYWLVNNTFIQAAYPDGRISMSESYFKGGSVILKRNLKIVEVLPEDFNSDFICVVTNPAGRAKTTIRLTQSNRSTPDHTRS